MLHAKVLNLKTDEFRDVVLSPESSPDRECVIGRHPNCDLILDSPEIGNFHAKIIFQNGEYLLNDLSGQKGCRLNNHVLQLHANYVLEISDALHVGNFLFLIQDME
ncbi:MAG: FHA domain-containing protein [Oscillatoriophycideae cyanobacterium NC_groundwater_1537_Pr4_S-0.65um_50_18]|nr:FHA domain-containing protein [Oscillatoriophycideae cyanobacterium NC_groundwater_1537_Pr4_S-0.65um_50_18]